MDIKGRWAAYLRNRRASLENGGTLYKSTHAASILPLRTWMPLLAQP